MHYKKSSQRNEYDRKGNNINKQKISCVPWIGRLDPDLKTAIDPQTNLHVELTLTKISGFFVNIDNVILLHGPERL